MTIQDLIKELEKYDPRTDVVVWSCFKDQIVPHVKVEYDKDDNRVLVESF